MTKLAIIPALTVGSLYLIRRKVSSKWLYLDTKNGSKNKYDLKGKVCVITGGNTGLGFVAARELARCDGTVVLACRDAEKGRRAVGDIVRATGNQRVDCVELDLADLDSVRGFRSRLVDRLSSLKKNDDGDGDDDGDDDGDAETDVYALVCNAGVWMPMERRQRTKDDFEIHFGVNHLGHFSLVQNLAPLLRAYNRNRAKRGDVADDHDSNVDASTSRVVFVSSGLMKSGKIDFEKQDFVREGRRPVEDEDDDDHDQRGEKKKKKKRKSHAPTGYCDSKLMNALTCRRIAAANNDADADGAPVPCYAVCPGWCHTELARHVHMPFYAKILFSPFAFFFMRSSTQGAQNLLFAALEGGKNSDVRLVDGGFYRDGKLSPDETSILDGLTTKSDDQAARLWTLSEKLIADRLTTDRKG